MAGIRMVNAAGALAAVVAAGCSSSGGSEPDTVVLPCTAARAASATQTLITRDGFTPACVKIKAGTEFAFVDGENKHHTATARKGSPTTFSGSLSGKGATFSNRFRKPGTYTVYDKVTDRVMTLIVK
jgi:plastocyanin